MPFIQYDVILFCFFLNQKFLLLPKCLIIYAKMRIYTTLAVLFLGLYFCTDMYGQSRRLDRAEKAWAAGEYYEAIDLYKDAYSAVSDRDVRSEIIFLIAQCYMKVSDARQSESWFRRAINRNFDNPEIHWYYGEALKMNEKL
jgi:tetratricopeptide (TPR) repeat protein